MFTDASLTPLASQQATIATLTTVVADLTAQVGELVSLKDEHAALLEKNGQKKLSAQLRRLQLLLLGRIVRALDGGLRKSLIFSQQ